MNPYLTDKANTNLYKKLPGKVFLLLLALSSLGVIGEKTAAGETGTVLATLVLLVLFVWPLVRYGKALYRAAQAKRIANQLAAITASELPLSGISTALQTQNASKILKSLIQNGYLQNISIDWMKSIVMLTAPHGDVEKQQITSVTCPHCGAENMIPKGRVGRCSYCDQPLMITRSKK